MQVHSRTGLVITGIVQMLASGVMSLSLCALSGYKFNLGEHYEPYSAIFSADRRFHSAGKAHTVPHRGARRG